MLPGGRLTEEDAYAYAKFARVVLGTNDIDYRSRPSSAEELAFLGAAVAGSTPETGAVTYTDLERAGTVLLVGFEPEEESPITFLRLHKAVRNGRCTVYSIAALASRGLDKLGGRLLPARARRRGRGDRRRSDARAARRAGHRRSSWSASGWRWFPVR